jgi:hypothetical protein
VFFEHLALLWKQATRTSDPDFRNSKIPIPGHNTFTMKKFHFLLILLFVLIGVAACTNSRPKPIATVVNILPNDTLVIRWPSDSIDTISADPDCWTLVREEFGRGKQVSVSIDEKNKASEIKEAE